jgi:hypothetical protein
MLFCEVKIQRIGIFGMRYRKTNIIRLLIYPGIQSNTRRSFYSSLSFTVECFAGYFFSIFLVKTDASKSISNARQDKIG